MQTLFCSHFKLGLLRNVFAMALHVYQKHIVVDHVEHLLDTAIKLTVDALLIFFSACIFLWINNF